MIICNELFDMGFTFHSLDDAGQIAMIKTPFKFDDGDFVSVFVQQVGGQLRFFDDGLLCLHFHECGFDFSLMGAVEDAVAACGCIVNENGVVEVFCDVSTATEHFSRYIEMLVALIRWDGL